ncbi:uncharacterized protein SPSK_01407 [Sporothrix schenckii 1099-18]|uniref:Integral membrane protein n=2 Tax=Sporothrix schenckii TaxID=29908 RepID=U7PL84_SPOS1|nr:uncharacterized protein SPSK_01407 [Sporothrix schenckii 1099-18]ERS95295.1 hypothetical protein HMPREF1624_08173 [Sporothrix schenckii ATCC 58251]KJR87597.1 hypothetical protein SPSK_01407 [Sporothrix schenckii 1099-18]
MSNYPPYQNNPVQRRPVPGQAQQQQQQPTPPPGTTAAPQPAPQVPVQGHVQGQAPYQQPTYQTPHPYHGQPYPQQQQQYAPPNPNHLAPGTGEHAPILPPRPPGGAGPFLAQTYMSFPPPPRSPNRPPVLPPRPQASPQLQQHQQQQYQQQPPYSSPAPFAAPAPGSYAYNQQAFAQQAYPAPPAAASPAASPSAASGGQPTVAHQEVYYPPPPPLPPQQQQQPVQAVDPSAAATGYGPLPPPPAAQPAYDPHAAQPTPLPPQYTSSVQGQTFVSADKQQTTEPAAVPASVPPPPPFPPQAVPPDGHSQQYGTHYSYYDAQQAYPSPASHSAPTVSPQETAASPLATGPTAAPANSGHANDPVQQMNAMLQSMNIASEETTSAPPSEPAVLPASTTESLETPHTVPPAHSPQPAPSQGPPQLAHAQPAPAATKEQVHAASHPQPTQSDPALQEQAQTYTPQQVRLPPSSPHPPTQPVEQPAAAPLPQPESHDRAYPDPQYAHTNYPESTVATTAPVHATTPATATPAPEPAAAPVLEAPRHVEVDPPFKPVISCIDTPMAFNTWWYTHPNAPEAFICSKCYMDYLYPTQFQNHFGARYYRDGVRRRCRFKVDRITDQILPDAQATGSLQGLIDFMNQRLTIPDCKKLDGAKGGQGLKWFRAKHDAIPGLVICEACFLDAACISPFAYNFELSPPHDNAAEVWACDFAVPFIRKEFDERSKSNDWPTFCNEAKARLGMLACPKSTQAMISLRKWFTPVQGQGPTDAVLCAACYCDRVLKTGQEPLWENMPHDPIFSKKYTSDCIAGQFHILMAFSAAEENKAWPLFWRSLNKMAYEEKTCAAAGIKDGKWFTLPSQPAGFQVCGACYAGILESLNVAHFFVPLIHRPAPDTAVVCSLNVKAPRFGAQVDKLLETWFTQDCASMDTFNQRYGQVPPCCRDVDYTNRGWYGWPDCTICAECYLEFVKGTALDTPAAMPMHTPQIIAEACICEMYSPRMRGLYTEACAQKPPNPAALLAYSAQRRLVYWETMPICRNIVTQEAFLANNIAMTRLQSVAYTAGGNLQSVTSNHHDHTYGQAGVGYGYDNMQQLIGARYNVEANQMSSQLGGNKILVVAQLETRWKSVE